MQINRRAPAFPARFPPHLARKKGISHQAAAIHGLPPLGMAIASSIRFSACSMQNDEILIGMDYTWHFQIVWDYRMVFVRGALVTAQITFWATLIGLVLGLPLGLMRRSQVLVLCAPAATIVELFRSTPALVQLVWIYYSLPILTGLQMSNTVSVSVGLGLHASAYFAEIFRAGINSISRGQWDAAYATGMTYAQAMRRIILPQAIRRMVPPFINEFASLIKLTTLGSALAVYELLHESENLINSTYRPLEIYTVLALAFAVLIFPIIYASQLLERRWKVRQ
jgi:polar amino acid transport system permease protein